MVKKKRGGRKLKGKESRKSYLISLLSVRLRSFHQCVHFIFCATQIIDMNALIIYFLGPGPIIQSACARIQFRSGPRRGHGINVARHLVGWRRSMSIWSSRSQMILLREASPIACATRPRMSVTMATGCSRRGGAIILAREYAKRR